MLLKDTNCVPTSVKITKVTYNYSPNHSSRLCSLRSIEYSTGILAIHNDGSGLDAEFTKLAYECQDFEQTVKQLCAGKRGVPTPLSPAFTGRENEGE